VYVAVTPDMNLNGATTVPHSRIGMSHSANDPIRGMSAEDKIKDVWSSNLYEEFEKIRVLLKTFPVIAMVSP